MHVRSVTHSATRRGTAQMQNNDVDLARIAADTVTQLGDIWDQLGEARTERQRLIRTLCDDVAAIYSNLLAVQQQRVRDAREHIVEYAEHIEKMQVQLDRPVLVRLRARAPTRFAHAPTDR